METKETLIGPSIQRKAPITPLLLEQLAVRREVVAPRNVAAPTRLLIEDVAAFTSDIRGCVHWPRVSKLSSDICMVHTHDAMRRRSRCPR